ncbi:MAG: gamma-glutamyl-gamma-aminobutyrate hydrolase family protein [Alphaproteobacteria bacterium]
MRPLIGITLDWKESGSFSKRPHYCLRQAYFDAVYASGGLPIALPLHTEGHDDYLNMLHGVVVPGGDYPSPGWWYGKTDDVEAHPRATADVAIIRRVLARKMPLLGICAGMQTLAVATGGKLHWDIKTALGVQGHRTVAAEHEAHPVELRLGTKLRALTGDKLTVNVNSHHNEGVASVGPGVVVSATAPDGVIEAIEVPDHPFAVGVQWHPEFMLENGVDRALFEGLMAAAQKG